MEYLIPEEKVATVRTYRSGRVRDLMREHDLDFLYLWDYGNTRYAFDIMPRFHPESDNALMGYLISKEGVVCRIEVIHPHDGMQSFYVLRSALRVTGQGLGQLVPAEPFPLGAYFGPPVAQFRVGGM